MMIIIIIIIIIIIMSFVGAGPSPTQRLSREVNKEIYDLLLCTVLVCFTVPLINFEPSCTKNAF
jgi:hypothetical protein